MPISINSLWNGLKTQPQRVGRFWAGWLPTGPAWSFIILVFLVVLLVFMIPAPAGDAYELQIPASGETVSTAFPLREGQLYKVTVSGVYRYRNGGVADAQFRSVSGSYDSLQPSVMLNDSLVRAQVLNLAEHSYTFYVAGDGETLTASIYDHWQRGFADDTGPYWDNGGYLTLNVREADFRCQPRHSTGAGYLIRYDLDPIPEPADTVTLKLWRLSSEGERKLVFAAATDEPVSAYGDRNRLSRNASNRFLWNGIGNIGSYADHAAPFGDYVVELVVESRGKRFSTVNWAEPDSLNHLAVLPGADSPDGAFQMVYGIDDNGQRLYGYKSPRAITPAFGPETIELADPMFTCLAWQPGITDAEGYSSPVLTYLKRRLNLALTTAFEQKGEVFPFCTDSGGQFDEELIRLLVAFRKEFDYETPTETAFLQRFGNLGTGTGEGAIPAVYYSRVVGIETFAALDELTFSLPGLPGEWQLNDFDNLPLYDAENPQRSLYHRFEEICSWVQELRPDGKVHPGWEIDRELALDWGKRYDIAPAAFQAFCEAVSYQECGLMHVLGSGRSYRAASGHGSATGYTQLTGAVVRGGNYQLRYPNNGETQRVAFASLPKETRYDLRYLAELNLQVGIQYLRLVLSTQSRWVFDPRFQMAFRPGGVLDFTTWSGTVRRLKMAGVMYNAGPYGIKVILRDIYSTIPPPPRGANESNYYAGQMAAIPTLRAIEAELSDSSPSSTDEAEAHLEDIEVSATALMSIPDDFPWSAPPAYNMDYEGMPGLDYFFGACEGDIEPFLIRLALDLRRYIAGEYHFPCESYPGGEERLYEIFKMLGPFWINRGAGGDWARAALMKLEREVIGYVRGMGRNVSVFWDSGEVIFRERAFHLLSSRGKTLAELAEEAPMVGGADDESGETAAFLGEELSTDELSIEP